jgi:glycosyltransferase involved in cell wall biosynthesis
MVTIESDVAAPENHDLVSVVIPTYNRAYILGRAIESVLQQTHRSVEVIVIDDGSTDDTRRLVESFGPPVRYFYQANSGVSSARNHGLRMARGEFVALLDSDDRWLPWKLAAQVQLMRSFPELGMIWTDMLAVDAEGRVLHHAFLRQMYSAHRTMRIEEICILVGRLGALCHGMPAEAADRPFYCGDIFSQMILGNLVHTSTVLLRRDRLEKVGGFDEALLKSGEDYEFHLHTCFYGPVGFIDAASIAYRTSAEDQLTGPSYMLHIARNNLVTVQKWLAIGRERVTLPAVVIRRHMAKCYEWLGSEKYIAGCPWGGRADQVRSLRIRPWQPRLWAHLAYHFLPNFVRRGIRRLRGRHLPLKATGSLA